MGSESIRSFLLRLAIILLLIFAIAYVLYGTLDTVMQYGGSRAW